MLPRRALLTLVLLLVPVSARAQISDADRATARTLAEEGGKALRSKDYAAAADRYERAFALVHAPTVALGLARARMGLGKWVAAHEIYNGIVHDGVAAGAPPAFVRAVGDAQRELDALSPRLPGVVIEVKGPGAATARVTIDGAVVPSAVLGVKRLVDPGRHAIRAEAGGYQPVEAAVTVAERGSEKVTLTLDRVDASRPPAPPEAKPGPSSDGAAPPPGPEAAPRGGTQKALGFAGIGVGGAGLVMGAVTGALAVSKHSALSPSCPNGHCTGQQSAVDSFNLLANLSTAGFVAGGVLAAAGVVLVATAPRSSPAKSARIVPVVGVGYVGAAGRF